MKMIQSKIFHTLIAFLLIQSTAFAATLYVKPVGNDGNPGTSWDVAKCAVRAVISAANAGDEIWVAARTYNEHITNREIDGLAVDVAL